MSPLGRRRRLELPDALCALRSRNYRIFFAAQAVSMSGVWMHRVAIGWLVFRLTESSNALGIMDFCAAFPIILFTAVAGAIVERLDLRKTMIVCQTGCAVVACVTAFLAFTDLATFRLLVILTLLRGVIDSFEMPTRYALVSFLVDRKEDLPNAVALNSTVFNVARMIGPSIAGFVIHAAGEAICFLLNGAAYSSMIAAMKKIRLEKPPICRNGREKATPLRDAAEGIRQVRRSAPARYLLFMIMLTGFFAFPSIVLMPAMARAVLHGTSKTLGFLLMGVAAGALAASLVMAARKSPLGLGKVCSRMCAAFGAAVSLFALAPSVSLAVVLAAPIGFTMVGCTIACNSLLQLMSPPESRSRVMSLYTLAIMGFPTFGSLLAGRLGDTLGTNWALFVCGLLCTAQAFYFMKKLDGSETQITKALIRQGAVGRNRGVKGRRRPGKRRKFNPLVPRAYGLSKKGPVF